MPARAVTGYSAVFGDYRGFCFEEPFAFWPRLLIAADQVMRVLYGNDLDRGNKTARLLDAFHQPQGLVGYSLRRARRVDLQFIAPTPIPPLQATTIIIVARNFFGFSI
jgi:hypothetical protein